MMLIRDIELHGLVPAALLRMLGFCSSHCSRLVELRALLWIIWVDDVASGNFPLACRVEAYRVGSVLVPITETRYVSSLLQITNDRQCLSRADCRLLKIRSPP